MAPSKQKGVLTAIDSCGKDRTLFRGMRRGIGPQGNLFLLGIAVMLFAVFACTEPATPDIGPGNHHDSSDVSGSDGDTNGTSDGDADSDTDSDADSDSDSDVIDTTRCVEETPPPTYCNFVAPPACGDGEINLDLNEQCDDGNTVPGDGCTGVCKIENNYDCPTPGQPCISRLVCGNKNRDPGELCDDGNTADGDGCNANCDIVDPNYDCSVTGQLCILLYYCGDKRIKGGETCDDGNAVSNDGCSDTCQKEAGWTCNMPGQPCVPVEVCGDGKKSVALNEACDDGNTAAGDGCAADCSYVEQDWLCETPGQPCVNQAVCGDGKLATNEQCDDGNIVATDGCDNCVKQAGYDCPFPNAPCIAICGDGIVLLNEECDDQNLVNFDGCSDTCEWEEGYACTGSVADGTWACHETDCGDGTKEGSEGCDQGDMIPGDGCSAACQVEPTCAAAGGACTSACGDGIIMASSNEVCDDGNTVDGDGCSSACQQEAGYECIRPELDDELRVPIILRDFLETTDDFQYPGEDTDDIAYGLVEAETGLVRDTLSTDKKPVFVGSPGDGLITSGTSFDAWYRNPADPAATVVSELILYDDEGDGSYVNRYEDDGGKWERLDEEYDGNPVFFPLDHLGITPDDAAYYPAKIPPLYFGWDGTGDVDEECILGEGCNPCWPIECIEGETWSEDPAVGDCAPSGYTMTWYDCYDDTPLHNFHFTDQLIYWFQYTAGTTYELSFVGDDDLWVFLNGKLALDLGGIHVAVEDTLTINNTTADDYGLDDGKVYEIMVFHAERETYASTYKLTLSGFNASSSKCDPECGDGTVTPGEQCDDGVLAGGYNQCAAGCVLGPYCGDSTVQSADGEDCDNGSNNSSYGAAGCAPGCKTPPRCGDQIIQNIEGEQCDDGDAGNTGAYSGCTSTCQRAPRCGDANLDAADGELCDDGVNDGSYGNCGVNCTIGPHCGDGNVDNGWEECDDGNSIDGDGCSHLCKFDGCGDGMAKTDINPETQLPYEQCDDGFNDGGYGECAPGCVWGPRCGDGITQTEYGEACDDGILDNSYGGCAPGCGLGPRCGDGSVQLGFEECDEGGETVLCASCKDVIIGVF